MKKFIIAGMVVLAAGYLIFGYFFVHQREEPEKPVNVNAGQEMGKAMYDMEKKALREKQKIQADLKEGGMTKEELASQLKDRARYLAKHLDEMEDKDICLNMLYESAVFLSFSHVPESSKTEVQRQIEHHEISHLADRVHTYVVGSSFEYTADERMEKKLRKGLRSLKKSDFTEFAQLVEQDAYESESGKHLEGEKKSAAGVTQSAENDRFRIKVVGCRDGNLLLHP